MPALTESTGAVKMDPTLGSPESLFKISQKNFFQK